MQTGDGPGFRMTGDHMRRRLLFLVVLAVLAAPSVAVAGQGVSMELGATLTIKGRTGSDTGKERAVGKVVVSGRWGLGPWRLLTTTMTDSAGSYRFTITPHRRGTLTLRITPPDHQPRRYVVRVH